MGLKTRGIHQNENRQKNWQKKSQFNFSLVAQYATQKINKYKYPTSKKKKMRKVYIQSTQKPKINK